MQYTDLIKKFNAIIELQRLKGSKWKFNFLLIEIKKKTTETVNKFNEELKTLQEAIANLKLEHCERDKNGKAVVFYNPVGGVKHKGLALGECPEYDDAMKEIDKKVTEINNTEIDIDLSDIKKIKKDVCPLSEMTGEHWELLSEWIEDFHL